VNAYQLINTHLFKLYILVQFIKKSESIVYRIQIRFILHTYLSYYIFRLFHLPVIRADSDRFSRVICRGPDPIPIFEGPGLIKKPLLNYDWPGPTKNLNFNGPLLELRYRPMGTTTFLNIYSYINTV
jgi:hypothetical protein